jgi:hypothetical protein
MSAAGARKSSASDWSWRSLLFIAAVPVVLWAALWAASLASVSSRIPQEIANSAGEKTVLICKDGTIVFEGDSLVDHLFGTGSFRCTDWHIRGPQRNPGARTNDWPTSPKR